MPLVILNLMFIIAQTCVKCLLFVIYQCIIAQVIVFIRRVCAIGLEFSMGFDLASF